MRPLNSAIPGALAALLRSTPHSAGKLALAWRAAVGPAIERVTAVKLEGGTLLVDAADAHWAREVARSTPIVLARLQDLLGRELITNLQVRSKT